MVDLSERADARDHTNPAPAEAWLRGPVVGVDPWLMPAAHALVQARDDLLRVAAGLTHAQLWARPGGAASIGFHIRHAGGATERLLTYARGESLDAARLAAAAAEAEPAGPETGADALAAQTAAVLERALEQLRATSRTTLLEPRSVGRAALPSTVLGLLFHAAEHAARHAGQAVTLAKVVRALG